jgi:hypothetical protein
MERYKPKQEKQPIKAIREMCIECMGSRGNQGYAKLIARCTSPDCPLYKFRNGENPYHKQNLSDQQRKTLSDRARNSHLIQRVAGKSQSNLDENN